MEKIFIVEDDLSFGTIIQTWLRKKGFLSIPTFSWIRFTKP